MARKERPTGDKATNARKRYYRAAERHLKKASQLTGASAERERKLAEIQFNNALETYDPETTQKLSKPMQRLANEFGIDVDRQRRELQTMKGKQRESFYEKLRERRETAIGEESKKARERDLQDIEKRREYEAEQLFSQQNIAHRILGGLVNIWRKDENRGDDGKIKRERILPSLFEHYKVGKLSELLEKIESEIGDMLYGADQEEIYDVVKLTLQLKNPKVA